MKYIIIIYISVIIYLIIGLDARNYMKKIGETKAYQLKVFFLWLPMLIMSVIRNLFR